MRKCIELQTRVHRELSWTNQHSDDYIAGLIARRTFIKINHNFFINFFRFKSKFNQIIQYSMQKYISDLESK